MVHFKKFLRGSELMLTEIIFSVLIAAVLTFIGTRWINFLYAMPNAPLSFPDEIESRAKFRTPCLFLLLTICIFNLWTIPAPKFFYVAAAIFILSMIIFTDFEQYVIFDKMLLPFALIGGVEIFHLNLPFVERLIAAIIGGGIFLLLAILSRGGIGGGDIKLVAVLGMWLGIEKLLNVIIIAAIAGGIVAVILILTKQKDRKSYFAYGPYFALAAIYILIFG
ncbi:MAG: prepilin peptidase, partial [Selenomonadaceae bacterium]|nr:prepilin peptidase [Selenomonadaceae bacterium]